MDFAAALNAEIEAAKGLDFDSKHFRYLIFAARWKNTATLLEPLRVYTHGIWQVATEIYKWDENPPVWYHGGPAGLTEGDAILPFPRVPSVRRSPVQNMIARYGSILPRLTLVYFTPMRDLALTYCDQNKDGRIYRVQPEGEILSDPETFILVAMLMHDPEIDLDFQAHAVNSLPSWCAPSARVLSVE